MKQWIYKRHKCIKLNKKLTLDVREFLVTYKTLLIALIQSKLSTDGNQGYRTYGTWTKGTARRAGLLNLEESTTQLPHEKEKDEILHIIELYSR